MPTPKKYYAVTWRAMGYETICGSVFASYNHAWDHLQWLRSDGRKADLKIQELAAPAPPPAKPKKTGSKKELKEFRSIGGFAIGM